MTSFIDAHTAVPGRRPTRAWFWSGFVIALIVSQLAVCAVTSYLALSEPTFAVEPDYYASAVQWDARAAQQRRNRELGWTVELDVSASECAHGVRIVTCTIKDRNGGPIRDATAQLTAFAHVNARARQQLTPTPDSSGAYVSKIRMPVAGLWEFRLSVQRDDTSFTAIELLEVAPASGLQQ